MAARRYVEKTNCVCVRYWPHVFRETAGVQADRYQPAKRVVDAFDLVVFVLLVRRRILEHNRFVFEERDGAFR